MLELEWDGERVVPGKTPEAVFRQTEMRYVFAGRFAKGCVVLDVASGSGIGTHHLLRAGAKCCIGLDLSPESTQYASSNYPGCNFAVCNAADLCLADRSVDLIVSFETIEHLPDPTAFLLQCKRVLRPNGLLLCSTPNWSTYRYWLPNPFHISEMATQEFLRTMQEVYVGCRLYGQCFVEYPLFVARRMTAKLLQNLRLRDFAKGFVRAPLEGVCTQVEFSLEDRYPLEAVVPYTHKWHKQPQYVIVVGRNAS
jgi:SAM-dependent methyltransferase